MQIDAIRYINLDRRADRRAHMECCLSGAPVAPQRIAATEFAQPPERLGLRMRPEHCGNASIAAIFHSHRRAIESARAATGAGCALILEDDCQLSRSVWQQDIDLSHQAGDWRMILISPRFRKIGSPDHRPRLSGLQRLNPLRDAYWQKPLQPYQARAAQALLQDYVISGAHFVVFRNREALDLVLGIMDRTEQLYHVDHFYCAEIPGCYALALPQVRTCGLGSDNRRHPPAGQ